MILLDDTISSEDAQFAVDAMLIIEIENVSNSFDAPMIALEEDIGTHLDSPMLHSWQNHDEIDIEPLPQPCVQLPSVRISLRKSSITPKQQKRRSKKDPKPIASLKRPCDVDCEFRTYCATAGILPGDLFTDNAAFFNFDLNHNPETFYIGFDWRS